MEGRTFKMTKVVGESPESIEMAAANALKMSGKAVRGHDWAKVVDIRANLNDDASVDLWQVTVEVAFQVEEESV